MKFLLKILLSLTPVLISPSLDAQPYLEGSTSPDFELSVHGTADKFNLYDAREKIIVLDFFAYWCPPCAFASPDVENNIQRYYTGQGGNPNGIPVQVISINFEDQNVSATNQFIEEIGIDFVLDDEDFRVFSMYSDTGGIPLFVVINGLSDAEGLQQWEVLFAESSYPGSGFLRGIIDPIDRLPEQVGLFDSLPDFGNDWRMSPWLGLLNTTSTDNIYHKDHGWLTIPWTSTEDSFLYFDEAWGWMYTTKDIYPLIFSYLEGSWLWFEQVNGPRFWHYGNTMWVESPI